MSRDLHQRLAGISNATVHRLRHVLRCAEPCDTLRALADEYHRIAGAKVNRGRLRDALGTLAEIGDIELDDSGDSLSIRIISELELLPELEEERAPQPATQPAPVPRRMTQEEWRNSPEGIAEEADRQALLDAADADVKARSVSMPDDAQEWLERQRRRQEKKWLEEHDLEDE